MKSGLATRESPSDLFQKTRHSPREKSLYPDPGPLRTRNQIPSRSSKPSALSGKKRLDTCLYLNKRVCITDVLKWFRRCWAPLQSLAVVLKVARGACCQFRVRPGNSPCCRLVSQCVTPHLGVTLLIKSHRLHGSSPQQIL